MSEVALTEVSEEIFSLDMMLYEILFEIFRRISKDKLIEISKLCSKFRDVAEDTRFWKNVYIKYEPCRRPKFEVFAFEELYSEPWPVNAIDLSNTKIKEPVSSKTDQVVKVTRLNLSSISANKVTMEAILAKYQCTELYMNSFNGESIMENLQPTFSKQTDLKVLLLGGIVLKDMEVGDIDIQIGDYLSNFEMLGLTKNLPPSLEKLYLVQALCLEDSFFESLAEVTPNLKAIRLCYTETAVFPSLLKFQFLEDLHISLYSEQVQVNSDFFEYLIQFPALKNVYIDHRTFYEDTRTYLENLRKKLGSHDINLRLTEEPKWSRPANGTLWNVKKAV